MSLDLIKFFIVWGPTFLFIFILLSGFFVGLIRGFRKSLILFIHMLIAGVICLCLYLIMVNKSDLDEFLVNGTNGVLATFGQSLQKLLQVDEAHTTLHEMIFEMVIKGYSAEELWYYIIVDDAAYIKAIVELAYRLVLFFLDLILYGLIIFILYLFYLAFYRVGRKIKKHNRRFQRGEVPSPYKKRRLLGGTIGLVRSLITGIICFSFLGSVIWIVTGGDGHELMDREEAEISFENEFYNEIYDYYSYICEMGDTGIFKALNSIKDSKNTPYYFYIADIVLQGQFTDENLMVKDKFYLRDETGAYVAFIKDVYNLLLKYGGNEAAHLLESGDINIVLSIMSKEGFSEELNVLIDNFEAKPYVVNLCLASLTSVINHIDKVTDDEVIIALIRQVFDSEEGIKVTDLATSEDVKSLFKAVVNVVADISNEPQPLSDEDQGSPFDGLMKDTKRLIGYAQKLLPTIENLSLFQTRKEKGNKVLGNLYRFCSTQFVDETLTLPEIPNDIVWTDEFVQLLKAADPLCYLIADIYSDDEKVLKRNVVNLFDSNKENLVMIEEKYDAFVSLLTESKLLDVVFKSSLVGEQVDALIIELTKNDEAIIPKNIDYGQTAEADGECKTLLISFKYLLKNGGETLYELLDAKDSEYSSETILSIFEILKKKIDPEDETSNTVMQELLKSKLMHYAISSYLTYADLQGFAIYAPDQAVEILVEGTGENAITYRIIKKAEISLIVDTILQCEDLVIEFMGENEDIDYSGILTNEYVLSALEESFLLKGTIANIIIQESFTNGNIILPYGYDDPEAWLSTTSTKGEIDVLVQSIKALSSIKDEDDIPIINTLLSGKISTNTLFNLDEQTIGSLCDSTVLRYTISDMLTDIGDTSFEIIVPFSELEMAEAPTVNADKKVNVIKSSNLKKTFNDILQIAEIEGNDIKIKYSQVFANKESLLENLTIQATLMNLIIKQSKEADATIAVPSAYLDDFKAIVNSNDLTNNKWLNDNTTTTDDELYYILVAVEGLITDENGVVPEDFDLEKDLEESIRIDKANINTVTRSVILNASITKSVLENLKTPKSVYEDEIIKKTELDALFDSAFELLDKDELTFEDLKSISIDSLVLTREKLANAKSSQIILANICDNLAEVDGVLIPNEVVFEVEVVSDDAVKVNQLFEKEYDAYLDALFILFSEEGKLIIDNINPDNILITKDRVETMVASGIINAIITHKLQGIELISIPLDTITASGVTAKGENYNTTEKTELANLLYMLLDLIGGDSQSIQPNLINLKSVELVESFEVSKSMILRATLSTQIKDFESLVIPTKNLEKVSLLDKEQEMIFSVEELDALVQGLIKALGTDGRFVIDLEDSNSIDVENISLTEAKLNEMLKSGVLAATISKNVIIPELNILESDTTEEEVYHSSSMQIIVKEELQRLFGGLFALVGDEITVSEVKDVDFTTIRKDSVDKLLESNILNATISQKILEISELSIPSIILKQEVFINQSAEELIYREETKALLDSLFATTSSGTELDISSNFSISSILLPKTKEAVDEMLASMIVSATLSDKIYENNQKEGQEVILLDDTLVKYEYLGTFSTKNYILKDELAYLILALTNGLGIESADKMDTIEIDVPASEAAKLALVGSRNIRATITKTVLEESNTKYASVRVEDKVYELADYQNQSVIVFNEKEILALIKGLEILSSDNKSFKNLGFDIITLINMEASGKQNALYAIAGSAIYRSIISGYLTEDYIYPSLEMYKTLSVADETKILSNGVNYQYQPYSLNIYNYYIIQSTNRVTTYSTFVVGHTTERDLFTANDIIALENAVYLY